MAYALIAPDHLHPFDIIIFGKVELSCQQMPISAFLNVFSPIKHPCRSFGILDKFINSIYLSISQASHSSVLIDFGEIAYHISEHEAYAFDHGEAMDNRLA